MAEDRRPAETGSASPANEEAKRQGMAGDRGAEAGQTPGMGAQPEQGSNRSPAKRHEQAPEERKGFAPGHAPSEQGEKGNPSPHVIARHQQGHEPSSGSHSAHGERSEERARSGAPREEHPRHGRQDVPGGRGNG